MKALCQIFRQTTMKSEDSLLIWENKYLKHLQFIATIVGLSIPNLYSYNGLSVWYILYSLIVITLLIVMLVLATLTWINLFHVKVLGTVVVLNCMCLVIMTFSNVIAIVCVVIVKRKRAVQLVTLLKDIDQAMNANNWIMEANPTFSYIFISIHVFMLLHLIMEIIFNIFVFGVNSLLLPIFNAFFIYIHTVNVLQICSFPLRINHRCIHLNKILEDLIFMSQKATKVQEVNKILDDARLLFKIYDSICDSFELVSRCFGIQMVLVVCVSVIFIVRGFNTCIKYSLEKIHLVHKEHEYALLFISSTRCLILAVRYDFLH